MVRVKDVSVFSRVIPEHKMRIVKAFKKNGEIVAMTGDGVNDAPALKYADIGIAMGKRGSEVSREASDIILLDDNFSAIVDTIKDGRRIYDNIRKAVGYVFTIHIPIAFAALLAPLMGINPAGLLLLPLHVVLLELVIDPTCSIVLERQPAEHDITPMYIVVFGINFAPLVIEKVKQPEALREYLRSVGAQAYNKDLKGVIVILIVLTLLIVYGFILQNRYKKMKIPDNV